MASDECRTTVVSSKQDEYDGIDVGFDRYAQQLLPHNFSRFSLCTSSIDTDNDDDDDLGMSSGEDFSNEELLELSPDSDDEPCYFSRPAIPPHRRNRNGLSSKPFRGAVKDYGSDNYGSSSFREESVVIITRPKGGRRTLRMDTEEVMACRDLGFELEDEGVLEMPSSGADSPISNSSIPASDDRSLLSNLSDDPSAVKARLKLWAQAVVLASKSMDCTTQV